ncbi:AAA family ATPase [Thermosediminibacter litoriperuensis]|uniref:ATP-dependent metalloprotease FtsH n=1 Tax=Thermosediminibacter litoriperuensis TaxID=291989 RepID=A0A5S5AQK5_9FIRM|nr:ATP-dependent metalloprotease FtsH [Thermosediminibacter litoriperuensis]
MFVEVAIGIALAVTVFLLINGINVLPLAVIGLLAYVLQNYIDKSSIIKNPSRVATGGKSVTFEDIGGQETAKNELLEALDFIKNYDEVRQMGIRPLKGILLTGAPGTGKTLLAKAASSYIDSAFISASGSEFIEMYAGVGAQRVRQLFKTARDLAKKNSKKHCVIFIDEIEVIAGVRGINTSHMEYDQTLNQLLVEMDGLSAKDDDVNILVIGATNRPDILDPAILRPGRFDRIVKVDLPDKEGRYQILKLHTKDKPLADDVNLEQIARETFGFSGAHLESLCNEAAILAMRSGQRVISQCHFMEAIDKVIMGEKMNRKPTKNEMRRIAVHECGHALISEYFKPNSVSTITVTSRGEALGYMRQKQEDDMYLYTKNHLEAQIAIALAGAAAEEIMLGDGSTGASGDIDHAVELAKEIIFSGMSDIGVVDRDSIPLKELHKEISKIISTQKEKVKEIIEKHKGELNTIIDYLMENEKIDGETFRSFLKDLKNFKAA